MRTVAAKLTAALPQLLLRSPCKVDQKSANASAVLPLDLRCTEASGLSWAVRFIALNGELHDLLFHNMAHSLECVVESWGQVQRQCATVCCGV